MMAKYLALLKISWQNGLVYRASIVLWRFRQLLSTLMALTVWSVIYTNQQAAFGYDRTQMISYVFLVSILQSIVLATSLHGLANRIYSGELSNELLKPIKLTSYLFIQDISDKAKNLSFIVLETIALFFIFQPQITLPDTSTFLLFIFWVVLAIILHFFITLLFGAIGFFSPDSWGPKFLFFMIVDFTAGKLFPLDILPRVLQKIIFFTPFPYLSYTQIQLFLGRMQPREMFTNTVALLSWTLVLGLAYKYVWGFSLKRYSAAGR